MSAQIQNFNMIVFQHKHNKVGSIYFLNLIMETSMLPLIFYELNTKFEKLLYNKK
jgi:hypothetical protein